MTKVVSVNDAGLAVENPATQVCFMDQQHWHYLEAYQKYGIMDLIQTIRIWVLIRSLDGTRAVALNPDCKQEHLEASLKTDSQSPHTAREVDL